ncbi:MAG: thioredoxin [Polyangiales bacterium]
MTPARPPTSHRVSPFASFAFASLLVACAPTTPRRASRDAGAPRAPTPAAPHIRFEHAGEGAPAPLVRAFVDRAHAEGRIALVYVGATWCEPCRYFHAAAERGELDAVLPSLALLEFDLDRDGARLAEAGYRSQMIPLFAVPSPDGRASGRQIEGSIHGPGSPAQITPRLRAILDPGATSTQAP